jgi:transposase
MRFYTGQHRFYCGIDLHARSMFVCILDTQGIVLVHKNIKATPEDFLTIVAPYRDNLAVAVECIFSWYWLADLCAREKIPFILGHALYMKAIHGGKSKNDKIDALKIATLLRGGMIPQAYVYPAQMRATRDLLRRRMHLMRKRAELLAHIQNTTSQYNLPEFEKVIAYKKNRSGVADVFSDPTVRTSITADLELIDHYDDLLKRLELFILRSARVHDPNALLRLRSVPGIGKILSLVILYEIHDVLRFPSVQDFASYSRLVRCSHLSAGKRVGSGGRKIGNAHLKWAFSEAAVLFLRGNPEAQAWLARQATKHGKPKALSILAHKLGRAVYFLLSRERAFEMNRFLTA